MSDSNHETAKCDFFVSYHHRDEPWAEWIAWRLNKAGYTVRVQAWDLAAGSKFVSDMRQAASRADRIIAVLSSNYLASTLTRADWAFAFQQDPRGEKGLLIPVRVQAARTSRNSGPVGLCRLCWCGRDRVPAAAIEQCSHRSQEDAGTRDLSRRYGHAGC